MKRQWWGESDKSEGLQIIGQIGVASPQNELNYLALEAVSWNPQLDYQTWIDQELAPLYGGPKLSRRFYELVSNSTKQSQEIANDLIEAQQNLEKIAGPRQARRWSNLISELRRRQALMQ